MAFVRKIRGKRGTTFHVVSYIDGRKMARSAGRSRALAYRWAAKLDELKVRRRAGFQDADAPPAARWSLQTLRDRDLAEAKARGLETRSRERRWRVLLTHFDPKDSLDTLTTASLAEYARERDAKPATINRDLSVLSAALKMARRLAEESGYMSDPTFPKLEERRSRRRGIALNMEQAIRFVGICRRLHVKLANQVELMLLTGQRISERPVVQGDVLLYPAHKRGRPRAFLLVGRLKELVASPRSWSRRAWDAAVTEMGMPLRPQDLRHTAATLAALEGRTIPGIQNLLGHRGPQMAGEVYLHAHPDLLAPVKLE